MFATFVVVIIAILLANAGWAVFHALRANEPFSVHERRVRERGRHCSFKHRRS